MDIWGTEVEVTTGATRVYVRQGGSLYGYPVPANEHLVVVEYEDTRDNSRYFELMAESEVERTLAAIDRMRTEFPSAYEYIGQTCHWQCPRQHNMSVRYGVLPEEL